MRPAENKELIPQSKESKGGFFDLEIGKSVPKKKKFTLFNLFKKKGDYQVLTEDKRDKTVFLHISIFFNLIFFFLLAGKA